MNASGQFQKSDRSRAAFGLHPWDLGWNAALGFVEGLISLRGNRATLAFYDERSFLRQAIDAAYRQEMSSRLALPGGGRVSALLAGLRRQTPAVRYAAATFVPSLLTFLEKKHRIGIAGENSGRVSALREQLSRHAPWHDIVALPAGEPIREPLDLVVVDARTTAEERRVERQLASARIALVIMAGRGLSGLLPGKPESASEKLAVRPVHAGRR